MGQLASKNLAEHLRPGNEGPSKGISAYYLNVTNLPQRERGKVSSDLEYFNHKK